MENPLSSRVTAIEPSKQVAGLRHDFLIHFNGLAALYNNIVKIHLNYPHNFLTQPPSSPDPGGLSIGD